ncbi:oxidoreductase [Chengkuizengella axinellae]|uniref:Oxidoreductase n=1 Tax=Chengkuizengella axinellae TaxID=3064388 RepID=A0ABT9J3H3_9BACL|nr:oxidoreductase [Chengkuizengella sp. 2205SS18-9]MDP5275987.1 oxidoreductase [Chengkuizengella sp. 2205SS18-9]
MQKSALIAGSTGLVGSELLRYLLDSKEYESVTAIVRKPLHITHPKLKEFIVDFEKLHEFEDVFKVNDVFCCLGTTIKKAKTKEAMTRIDVEYPLVMAKLAKKMGAKQFLVISAMQANPNSSTFYSRIKGEMEQELRKVGFDALHVFRPSLLVGDRKEFRLGEKSAEILFKALFFVFIGPLKKYKAIHAKTVASGMLKAAQSEKQGVNVYLSDEI